MGGEIPPEPVSEARVEPQLHGHPAPRTAIALASTDRVTRALSAWSVSSKAAWPPSRPQVNRLPPGLAARVQAEPQRLGLALAAVTSCPVGRFFVSAEICSGPRRCPWIPGEPRGNGMGATDQTLRYLAARAGTGDHAAFRCLYATLAPATLATVRDDLPDPAHSMDVVRAVFCEVWWMCAFDVRCGAHRHDVARWVASIAERRCDERRRAMDLAVRDGTPAGHTAFGTGLLDDDVSTQFQLPPCSTDMTLSSLLPTARRHCAERPPECRCRRR
jgi:hypothetical protein